MSTDSEDEGQSVSPRVAVGNGVDPSSGKASKVSAPLRRGLACAFCRRRKLRCSAEKPSCYHCIKLGQECVYDQGKRGKIQALEARIAELSAIIEGKSSASPASYDPSHRASEMLPPPPCMPVSPTNTAYSTPNASDSYHLQYPRAPSLLQTSYHPALPPPPIADEYPRYSTQEWQLGDAQRTMSRASIDQVPVREAGLAGSDTSCRDYSHGNHSIHQLLNPNSSELNTFPPATPESLSASIDGGPLYPSYQHLRYSKDSNDVGAAGRLGEFLFGRKIATSVGSLQRSDRVGVDPLLESLPDTGGTSDWGLTAPGVWERDELPDTLKDHLTQCYLSHHRIFFDMSLPRFYARLTLPNPQRPSPALLNAMYLWASRMSHSPDMSAYEQHFYDRSRQHLDTSLSTGTRIIDAIRAAMLLAAYSYSCGRHHEGFMMSGIVMRLVVSSGIHQITSAVFDPSANKPPNPFLRSKHFVLDPPIDSLDLGERIHTFWCAYAIDRAGSLATGFPVGIADEDITTPFPRPLEEYEMGLVTHEDNLTVTSLYIQRELGPRPPDSPYIRWLKSVALLDRVSKLALSAQTDNPDPLGPTGQLTGAHKEIHMALYRHIASMGEDGINPVRRMQLAAEAGHDKPMITPHTLSLHHILNAAEMYIYDVNYFSIQNENAVIAAQRSAEMIRELEPIAIGDVDAFLVLVWSFIAKLLVKEVQRLRSAGDLTAAAAVEDDATVVIDEMDRIGQTMHLARSSAQAMRVLMSLPAEEGLEGEKVGNAAIDLSMLS